MRTPHSYRTGSWTANVIRPFGSIGHATGSCQQQLLCKTTWPSYHGGFQLQWWLIGWKQISEMSGVSVRMEYLLNLLFKVRLLLYFIPYFCNVWACSLFWSVFQHSSPNLQVLICIESISLFTWLIYYFLVSSNIPKQMGGLLFLHLYK